MSHRARLLAAVVAAALAAAAAPVIADDAVTPRRLVRAFGPRVVEAPASGASTFAAPSAAGRWFLTARRDGPGVRADVLLNGRVVLGRRDFARGLARVEVSLAALNTIEVRGGGRGRGGGAARGRGSGRLTLVVEGVVPEDALATPRGRRVAELTLFEGDFARAGRRPGPCRHHDRSAVVEAPTPEGLFDVRIERAARSRVDLRWNGERLRDRGPRRELPAAVPIDALAANQLCVRVRGPRAASAVVSVRGVVVDEDAPALTLVGVAGALAPDATLALEADDAISGLHPGSLAVELNGRDVSSSFALDDGRAAVELRELPPAAFAVGENVLTARVTDRAGNAADAEARFRVRGPDLDPPTARTVEATGPDGAVVSFTAAASDPFDADAAVACDPPSGSVFGLGATEVVCVATNRWKGRTAGRFTVTVVDTTPPELTLAPGDGAILLSSHVDVRAAYADAATGVDPATLAVTLDGADVTDRIAAGPDAAAGALRLPAGAYALAVRIADRAGNVAAVDVGFEVDVAVRLELGLSPEDPAALQVLSSNDLSIRAVKASGALDPRWGGFVRIAGPGALDGLVVDVQGGAATLPGAAIFGRLGSQTLAAVALDDPPFDLRGALEVEVIVEEPAVELPPAPELEPNGWFVLDGVSFPGQRVELLVDGEVVASATAGPDGRFELSGLLPPGAYDVTVRSTDPESGADRTTATWPSSVPQLDPGEPPVAPGLAPVDPSRVERDPTTGLATARDQLLVGFAAGVTLEQKRAALRPFNARFQGALPQVGVDQLALPDAPGLALLARAEDGLAADPAVAHVWRNAAEVRLTGGVQPRAGQDPELVGLDGLDEGAPGGPNWAWEAVRAPTAWATTTGSPAVRLGLVEFASQRHEDLDENVDADASSPETSPEGDVYAAHQLGVAGIIGARGNNPIGVAGLNWRTRLVVRTLSVAPGATGPLADHAFLSDVIEQVTAALELGCRAVNLSIAADLAAREGGEVVRDAAGAPALDVTRFAQHRALFSGVLALAQERDALIVQGAGNRGADARLSGLFVAAKELVPDHVLVVGAAQLADDGAGLEPAVFSDDPGDASSHGDAVDVYAPGRDVLTLTLNDSVTDRFDGTSAAAPFVTGLAGLIWSADPELSAPAVRQHILQGARDGGRAIVDPAAPDVTRFLIDAGASLVPAWRPDHPLQLGGEVDVAVDGADRAHLAFLREDAIVHASRREGGWRAAEVDRYGDPLRPDDGRPRVAVGPDGRAVIAYTHREAGTPTLRVATQRAAGGDAWDRTVATARTGVASLAVDVLGRVHLAYFSEEPEGCVGPECLAERRLVYQPSAPDPGLAVPVEASGLEVHDPIPALSVDPGRVGHPGLRSPKTHLTFTVERRTGPARTFDLLYLTDAAGAFAQEVVASLARPIRSHASAVDALGRLHVIYATDDGAVTYATNQTPDGGWRDLTLRDAGAASEVAVVDVAVDAADVAHLLWIDWPAGAAGGTASARFAKVVDVTDGVAVGERVVVAGAPVATGTGARLAVSAGGVPHVAFSEPTGFVQHAVRRLGVALDDLPECPHDRTPVTTLLETLALLSGFARRNLAGAIAEHAGVSIAHVEAFRVRTFAMSGLTPRELIAEARAITNDTQKALALVVNNYAPRDDNFAPIAPGLDPEIYSASDKWNHFMTSAYLGYVGEFTGTEWVGFAIEVGDMFERWGALLGLGGRLEGFSETDMVADRYGAHFGDTLRREECAGER